MLSLVSEAKGITIKAAAEQLAEACGLAEKPTPPKAFDPEKYLATLDPAHEFLAVITFHPKHSRRPKDCDPRLYIFGAYHLTEGDVYLMHDPIDVLQATERGIPNCISFLTEKISTSQLQFLFRFMEDRKLENIVLA